jgi:hypothetical protein
VRRPQCRDWGLGKLPGAKAKQLRGLVGARVRRGGMVAAAGCSAPSIDWAERLGFGRGGCGWEQGGPRGGLKRAPGISACAPKKETGEVLARGSRLAVARPGEVGKTEDLTKGPSCQRASGNGDAGRAAAGANVRAQSSEDDMRA